jgi:N utilization substance protein B
MGSRRKSREVAFEMMFQWDLGQHTAASVIDTFLAPKKLDRETREFARALFEGAVGELESLDALLSEQAENWRLERMAAVDRNILRVAAFELIHYPDTPTPVVINEALEIARRFSGRDSVEFINGILDGVRRRQQSQNAAKPERRRQHDIIRDSGI